MILNLTQHEATPEQIVQGVVDLPPELRGELCRLLTVDDLPSQAQIKNRCETVAGLIFQTEAENAPTTVKLRCSMKVCCSKLLAVALLLGSPTALFAQASPVGDEVFRSVSNEVTFRYPAAWVQKESQLKTTIVLLYATDGSEATCNMNASSFPELKGLPEQKLDAFRKANHTREYFEKSLGNVFSGFSVTRHWRGQVGQKEAGAIEYRHQLLLNDTRITIHAFMVATFANGRRYTLNCNAPLGKEESAKRAFDYIRSTTLFMY